MVLFTPGPDARSERPATPDAVRGCHLRPLVQGDRPAFRRHLLRLDERSRRLRFGGPVNDAFIEAYVARTGDARRVGLFDGRALRGAAELHVSPADPALGEGAFSLEPAYRGRGHGTRLFDALLFEAEAAGVGRLDLQCLRENVVMQKIARRFAARLTFEGSETLATLDLPPAGVPVAGGWPAALLPFSPEPA